MLGPLMVRGRRRLTFSLGWTSPINAQHRNYHKTARRPCIRRSSRTHPRAGTTRLNRSTPPECKAGSG